MSQQSRNDRVMRQCQRRYDEAQPPEFWDDCEEPEDEDAPHPDSCICGHCPGEE